MHTKADIITGSLRNGGKSTGRGAALLEVAHASDKIKHVFVEILHCVGEMLPTRYEDVNTSVTINGQPCDGAHVAWSAAYTTAIPSKIADEWLRRGDVGGRAAQ